MNYNEFSDIVTEYLSLDKEFIFFIDFDCSCFFICSLEGAAQKGVLYDIRGKTNAENIDFAKKINLNFTPIKKDVFAKSFNNVIDHINKGDSYLLNLTFPTEIDINLSLKEVFQISKAPYKLLFKDEFVVFSPECFIKIKDNKIYTYPMKGTIDANIENAETILLNNKKEEWEHNTVVDLLRNDISIISDNVTVTKYRYVDTIDTCYGKILQTSSEIKGELPENWKQEFAKNIVKILPAGSITGAPKKKTIEIIKNNEIYSRGYYTGIFGIYDGEILDTAVSIRYMERNNNKIYFKSGCGITSNSNLDDEYNELIQKIYVPVI